MKKLMTTGMLLFLVAVSAGQARSQGPLSPPSRSPVPLTSAQQERARTESLEKEKAKEKAQAQQSTTASGPLVIKIPAPAVSTRFSTGNPAIDAMIAEAAAQHGLDPYLIFSVMRQESGFNRGAVSPKGASGLMQLMPATATRFGVRNIFDVRENILGGAKYLRWLLDRFGGDVRLALAGYNAGEGAVEFYGYKIPPFLETQNYVRAIYSRYVSLRSVNLPSVNQGKTGAEEPVKLAVAPSEKVPTYNQIIVIKSASGNTSAKKMD